MQLAVRVVPRLAGSKRRSMLRTRRVHDTKKCCTPPPPCTYTQLDAALSLVLPTHTSSTPLAGMYAECVATSSAAKTCASRNRSAYLGHTRTDRGAHGTLTTVHRTLRAHGTRLYPGGLEGWKARTEFEARGVLHARGRHGIVTLAHEGWAKRTIAVHGVLSLESRTGAGRQRRTRNLRARGAAWGPLCTLCWDWPQMSWGVRYVPCSSTYVRVEGGGAASGRTQV